MSEEKPGTPAGVRAVEGGAAPAPPKPPPPRTIDALSRARNSFTGLLLLGAVLAFLAAGALVALLNRSEHVKDFLILIGTIAGYIAGAMVQQRRDEA